uniref:CAAX prenyl protease 2 n=1 Tax=Ascaris lumbricoides TaxID=6252 RepID=A0A0M3HJG4_ASCLU
APITEELAFRACTAALVLQCVSPISAVFIAPLPFALSHLHHIFDDMKRGKTKQQAVLHRVFQMTYSYLFGAYATFLFVRTGEYLKILLNHNTFA